MKPKLILFDFFGTLAFLPHKSYLKFFSILKKFRYNIDLKDLKKKAKGTFFDFFGWAKNWEEGVRLILEKFGKKPKEEAVKEISSFLKGRLVFKFYDDIETIKELPTRKAILTTAPRFLLSNLKLEGFEKVFTPTDLKKMKPDPKAFLSALKILKASPQEALMVSNDLERDIIPAQNLGMKVILVDRENKIKNSPVKKISSLTELKNLLI